MEASIWGNLVFIQTNYGVSKIELTKRLSNALDILGITRYILLLDLYVEEFLGRRPISTGGATSNFKKPTPHFPILEPVAIRIRKCRRESKSSDFDEFDVQSQIIHAYVEKVHEKHPSEPWVLLVECSSRSRFDFVALEELSVKFSFTIHWLPMGTKKDLNSKFQSIVAEILRKKDSINKCNLKGEEDKIEVETIHQNVEAFDESQQPNSSKCVFDSFDVVLASPPFFNTTIRRRGSGTSGSYTSCPDSETDSSQSDLDFSNEVLEATMNFSKLLPPPDLNHYISIAKENPENNIKCEMPVFVVLVRDIFPGPASHISSLLKESLKRKGIKCRRLTISSLFVQPKPIEIMKHFAASQNISDFKTGLTSGCTSLVTNILHYKLSQSHREPTVLIFDLENERYIRLFTMLDFCVKIGQKVLVLEKRPDGCFEHNFNRVYAELKKGCVRTSRTQKVRKLKLPKFNLTFLKEFLPLDSATTLSKDGASVDMLKILNSDISHRIPTSIPTQSTIPKRGSSSTVPPATGRCSRSKERCNTFAQRYDEERVNHRLVKFVFGKQSPLAEEKLINARNQAYKDINGNVCVSHRPKNVGPESLPILAFASASTRVESVLTTGPAVLSYSFTSCMNSIGTTEDSMEAIYKRPLDVNSNPKNVLSEIPQKLEQPEVPSTVQAQGNSVIAPFKEISVMGNTSRPEAAAHRTKSRNDSYVGDEDGFREQSLIEICRLPQRKRRKTDDHYSETSEESLFKGWVGVPRKDLVKKNSKGFFSRVFRSIWSGIHIFIVGPIRKAFTQKNTRIIPSQMNRSDRGSGGPHRRMRRQNSYNLTSPPAMSDFQFKNKTSSAVNVTGQKDTVQRKRHSSHE